MGLDVGEMGVGLDLGLDLSLFAARSAGRMAAAAAAKGGPAAVDACVRSLEEERRKIEMFKRELPLCVRLLGDVIEELKEEAAKRGGGDAADDGDKRKWMSTAQLWVDSEAKSEESDKEQQSEITSPEPKLLGGGVPMPLRAVAAVPPPPPAYFRKDDDKAAGSDGPPAGLSLAVKRPLSLVTAGDERSENAAARLAATMPQPSAPALSLQAQAQAQQQARKARRCWSPELHRQFVAALHQLGGPQVATPKQIREVMQVDGLTNDEVKSHLQKYRLHNRRSSPGATPLSKQIVLVGGLWVPKEQSSSQSGSPEGPLQFSGSGSGVAASAATIGGDSSDEDDDKSGCYTVMPMEGRREIGGFA